MFKEKKIDNYIFSPFTRPLAIIKNKNHRPKAIHRGMWECFMCVSEYVSASMIIFANQHLRPKVIKYFYYRNVFDMDGA